MLERHFGTEDTNPRETPTVLSVSCTTRALKSAERPKDTRPGVRSTTIIPPTASLPTPFLQNITPMKPTAIPTHPRPTSAMPTHVKNTVSVPASTKRISSIPLPCFLERGEEAAQLTSLPDFSGDESIAPDAAPVDLNSAGLLRTPSGHVRRSLLGQRDHELVLHAPPYGHRSTASTFLREPQDDTTTCPPLLASARSRRTSRPGGSDLQVCEPPAAWAEDLDA